MARAIQYAANSAPGRDPLIAQHWLALGAWRLFGRLQTIWVGPMPWRAFGRLMRMRGTAATALTWVILYCIPKGEGEEHGQHGSVYLPEQTRPLSLVDVSNRMVASAYMYRWESFLGP